MSRQYARFCFQIIEYMVGGRRATVLTTFTVPFIADRNDEDDERTISPVPFPRSPAVGAATGAALSCAAMAWFAFLMSTGFATRS